MSNDYNTLEGAIRQSLDAPIEENFEAYLSRLAGCDLRPIVVDGEKLIKAMKKASKYAEEHPFKPSVNYREITDRDELKKIIRSLQV